MRTPADWMKPTDDRIVELLREEPPCTPPAVDTVGVPASDHTGKRLTTLARDSLGDHLSSDRSRRTDKGHASVDEAREPIDSE